MLILFSISLSVTMSAVFWITRCLNCLGFELFSFFFTLGIISGFRFACLVAFLDSVTSVGRFYGFCTFCEITRRIIQLFIGFTPPIISSFRPFILSGKIFFESISPFLNVSIFTISISFILLFFYAIFKTFLSFLTFS